MTIQISDDIKINAVTTNCWGYTINDQRRANEVLIYISDLQKYNCNKVNL